MGLQRYLPCLFVHQPSPCGESTLILTVRGKPIAALVSVENADVETVTLSTHPQFIALIERSRARQKAEGGISSEEMRRRLGLKKTTRGR